MLTLECKLEILKKLQAGILPSTLAREYNVGKSTITGIKQNEMRIREFISTAESQGMTATRKIMRLAKDEQVEQALYLWFLQKRSQGTPVSGPMLLKRVRDLAATKRYNSLKQVTLDSFLNKD